MSRYMAPALPPLGILAVLGAAALARLLGESSENRRAVAVGSILGILLVWPAVASLTRIPLKTDFRLAEAADRVGPSPVPSLWLVDATSGAEGAFIAEMAIRDLAMSQYVARASKLFAESNFMGTRYVLKLGTPAAVADELNRLGVQGVVLVRPDGKPAFPHGELLLAALEHAAPIYQRMTTLHHGNRPGETLIYIRHPPVAPAVDEIRLLGVPEKAAPLTGAAPGGREQ